MIYSRSAFYKGSVPTAAYRTKGITSSIQSIEGAPGESEFKTPKTEAGVVGKTRNWIRYVEGFQNAGATTLQAGDVCEWVVRHATAQITSAVDVEIAGIVLDNLDSNGCVQYDMYALCIGGPCWANKAITEAVSAGDLLRASAVAGELTAQDAPASDTEARDQVLNSGIKAMLDAAEADTQVLVWIPMGLR